MVDNVNLIRGFLQFPNEDVFYFIQIIVRRKDSSVSGKNRIIKTYYIHSLQDFDNKIEEIKSLCQVFGARAYINLNQRSFKNSAFHLMHELSEALLSEQYSSAKNLYNSVCGKYSAKGATKYWVVDLDGDDIDVEKVSEFIESLQPTDHKKVCLTVPTKNGVHLITTPFNLTDFRNEYPGVDVHKNNPTLLYFPL